jgi:hypothetical protein
MENRKYRIHYEPQALLHYVFPDVKSEVTVYTCHQNLYFTNYEN